MSIGNVYCYWLYLSANSGKIGLTDRVEKIREGLRKITQEYARKGYIDATPEPDFEVDEDRKIIDIILKLDEQIQYRIGNIEILGPNVATRDKLIESLPKIGDIFDATANRGILQSEPSNLATRCVNRRCEREA